MEEEQKEQKPEALKQEDKTKCWNCTRKVGLLGYDCKCGYTFCKKHRVPEDHECNFDFMNTERESLAKNNPLLISEKLDKI